MEFQVINRNRNAVIPEGMFKLCGMEDAKLISTDVPRDLPLGAPKGCTGWTHPHESCRGLQAAA